MRGFADLCSRRRSNGVVLVTGAVLSVLILLLGCVDPHGPDQRPPDSIVVMSYNLENLFDDHYDGTEYAEYDPRGAAWSTELYHAKLVNLTEVIKAAHRGGPDIIGVQEIENQRTLEFWVEQHLSRKGYREVLVAEGPGLAVNVGLISRYPILSARAHQVSRFETVPLRSILEAEIDCHGERLIVFVNHWPSKYGGAAASEPGRRAAAGVLLDRVREILRADPEAQILVMGDLNLNLDEFSRIGGLYQTALIQTVDEYAPEYSDTSVFVTFSPEEAGLYGSQLVLYSPWHLSEHPGSYLYQDEWETIDHFLLSPGLLNTTGFRKTSFQVFAPEFLLTSWGAPRRWISSNASGYSDHLALILKLSR